MVRGQRSRWQRPSWRWSNHGNHIKQGMEDFYWFNFQYGRYSCCINDIQKPKNVTCKFITNWWKSGAETSKTKQKTSRRLPPSAVFKKLLKRGGQQRREMRMNQKRAGWFVHAMTSVTSEYCPWIVLMSLTSEPYWAKVRGWVLHCNGLTWIGYERNDSNAKTFLRFLNFSSFSLIVTPVQTCCSGT
jgi:hypothetical protein